MTIKTITELKDMFKAGCLPTENNFADLIDSSGGTLQGASGTLSIRAKNEGTCAGNARGNHSVDLQTDRCLATQVASGNCSVIGGGSRNTATGYSSTVGGGWNNCATGNCSTIGGGCNNCATGCSSTIGGGSSNCATGVYSTIGGGIINYATGNCSTIGGGFINCATGNSSTIGGGSSNCATGVYSTIGGGDFNSATGERSTVGGGYFNCATEFASTVGGGDFNSATGHYSTIGGGHTNWATGHYSTIGGGTGAVASLYGEEARGSGFFNKIGDAQIREFILRNKTTQFSNTTILYLDGVSQEIIIPENTTWVFEITIVARSNNEIKSAGYMFNGVLESNVFFKIIEAENKTILYEDDMTWDCSIDIIDDNILRIVCQANEDVNWVAHTRVLQTQVSPSVGCC